MVSVTGLARLLERSEHSQDVRPEVSTLGVLGLKQGGVGICKGAVLFFCSCRLKEGEVSK